MKKIIGFLAVILIGFGLFACDPTDPPKPEPTDQDIVNAAKEALTLTTDEEHDAITKNITLSLSGNGGVTITWSSSNTAVVGINNTTAAVTRPSFEDGDAEVKLSAVLSLRDAEATKDFDIVVTKKEKVEVGNTDKIADILATGTKEEVYKLHGVVSEIMYNDTTQVGFYITDGTGTGYVFGTNELTVGDEIVLNVKYTTNKSFTQFSTPTNIEIISQGKTPDFSNGVITGKTINELFSVTTSVIDYGCQVFELQVKVFANNGPVDNPYLSFGLSDLATTASANIYYSGQSSNIPRMKLLFGHIEANVGKEITVYFTANGTSTSGKYRGTVLKIIGGATADPDLKAAQDALNAVTNPFATSYVAGATVTLPVTSGTHTVVWESSNDALITVAGATATITMPASGRTSVTLTYSVTVNGKTASKTASVSLGESTGDFNTWDEFRSAIKDEDVVVQGIVVGKELYAATYKNATVYLEGVDGGFVANRLTFADEAAYNALKIGNTIRVTGKKDIYSNLHQVGQGCTYEIISSAVSAVTTHDITAVIGTAGIDKYISQQVTAKGFTVKSIGTNTTTSYNLVLEKGSQTISIRVATGFIPAADASFAKFATDYPVGTMVNLTGILSVFNTEYQVFVRSLADVVIFSNADYDTAKAALDELGNDIFDANYTAGGTVNLPGTSKGQSLVWESNNDTVIGVVGLVATIVVPSEGMEQVVITVSCTVNGQVATRNYTVTVTGTIGDYSTLTEIKVATTMQGLTIRAKVVALGEDYGAFPRLVIVTDGTTNMVCVYTGAMGLYEIGKVYFFTGETKTGNVANTPVNFTTRFEIASAVVTEAEIASVAPEVLTFSDAAGVKEAGKSIDLILDSGMQFQFTTVKFTHVDGLPSNSSQNTMYTSASADLRMSIYKTTLPAAANTTDVFTFTAYYVGTNKVDTDDTRILRFVCVENFAKVS